VKFALFDELEIQRQHREIAAAGTPRRVIGGEFLFRQRLEPGIGGAGTAEITLSGRVGISAMASLINSSAS